MTDTDRVLGHVVCPYCEADVLMIANPMGPGAHGPPTGECCGRLFLCQPDGKVEVYVLDAEAGGVAP